MPQEIFFSVLDVFFLKSFTHESLGSLPRRRPKGGFGRTAWRMRGRLELGLPVAFYADWFLVAGEQQIKIHSYAKNKETSKIHNDKRGSYRGIPVMRDRLILFSVKREFNKLFFVIRHLKVLRDPWRTWIINRYSWFHHSIWRDFEMRVLRKTYFKTENIKCDK